MSLTKVNMDTQVNAALAKLPKVSANNLKFKVKTHKKAKGNKKLVSADISQKFTLSGTTVETPDTIATRLAPEPLPTAIVNPDELSLLQQQEAETANNNAAIDQLQIIGQ